LLQAAERLVHEGGPAALAVRSVAEAAGTTTRAVYSVFGSKAGLLEALATQLFHTLGEAIDAVPRSDDPVADVVAASIEGFRRTALEHPSLYSLVFLRVVPELERGPDVATAAAAAFARLESLLSRVGSATGAAANRSPAQAARQVHALTEGLATIELRGELGPPERARAVWHDAVTALVRGLALVDGSPQSAPLRAPAPARS
jgi:AcrR family transcriptional regulator